MTKEQFEALDLREQLTDELKQKWYYSERKWGLVVNKHSVVFDKEFKFELNYHPNMFYGDPRFPDEVSQGFVLVTLNGDPKYDLSDYSGFFDNEESYDEDPDDILTAIVLYIANYI